MKSPASLPPLVIVLMRLNMGRNGACLSVSARHSLTTINRGRGYPWRGACGLFSEIVKVRSAPQPRGGYQLSFRGGGDCPPVRIVGDSPAPLLVWRRCLPLSLPFCRIPPAHPQPIQGGGRSGGGGIISRYIIKIYLTGVNCNHKIDDRPHLFNI